jgi:hypothetical protein
MRPYKIGFIYSVAALFLAGCGINPATYERSAMVEVISDSPEHMTVSAKDVRIAKTTGTTILTLPNEKLSFVKTVDKMSTKAEVFNLISDGPLEASAIKSLFSGLEVNSDDLVPETHTFRDNGYVDGVAESSRDRSISSGTAEEDFGSWSVTKNSRLCLDWVDWYSGDPTCYGVTKLGDRLLLNGKRHTFLYHILN